MPTAIWRGSARILTIRRGGADTQRTCCRAEAETGQASKVLDGDLDPFMEAALLQKVV